MNRIRSTVLFLRLTNKHWARECHAGTQIARKEYSSIFLIWPLSEVVDESLTE